MARFVAQRIRNFFPPPIDNHRAGRYIIDMDNGSNTNRNGHREDSVNKTERIKVEVAIEDATAQGNRIGRGTYIIEMPACYDPTLVTGEDILCDPAIRLVPTSEQGVS